jgi:hypothetical protein
MKEMTSIEMEMVAGGWDTVDYFSAMVGVAVGAFIAVAVPGAGAFASRAAGVAAAGMVKEMLDGPPYTPGLDDRYSPILTQ